MIKRFKRYSIISISVKSWLLREQVKNIISKYKSIVKKLSKKRRNLRKGTSLAVKLIKFEKFKHFELKLKTILSITEMQTLLFDHQD